MNYELAKKLRLAGWPQILHPWAVIVKRDNTFWPASATQHSKQYPVRPILSELIEACGDRFETLSRDTSTDQVVWLVNNYYDPEPKEEPIPPYGWFEGSTPEEAVANLWLALNERKTILEADGPEAAEMGMIHIAEK